MRRHGTLLLAGCLATGLWVAPRWAAATEAGEQVSSVQEPVAGDSLPVAPREPAAPVEPVGTGTRDGAVLEGTWKGDGAGWIEAELSLSDGTETEKVLPSPIEDAIPESVPAAVFDRTEPSIGRWLLSIPILSF